MLFMDQVRGFFGRVSWFKNNNVVHIITFFNNQLRLKQEVDTVVGQKTEIGNQELTELKYCAAVFKEALRMYPTAPGMARENPQEFTFNGLKIPAHTTLFVSRLLCIHFFIYKAK